MKDMNQNGFGLIMVIISASIMSVLVLGISNMMVNNASSISYLEDRSNSLDFKNVLTLELSNSLACTNSLSSINLTSGSLNLNSIRDQSNTIVRNTNDSYDMISIGNMKIENVNVPLNTNSTGIANLIVTLNRLRGKQVLKPLTIPIQITTTSSNPLRVASCVAVGDAGALAGNAGGCDAPPPLCAPSYSSSRDSTRYCTYTENSSAPYTEGSIKTVKNSPYEGQTQHYWTYLCINKKWALVNTQSYD
jgi:hypothetical protein